MENNLVIDSGVVHLLINGGPEFIEFNPEDTLFVDKFYKLMQDFAEKKKDFDVRADKLKLESKGEKDLSTLPGSLVLINDMCSYLREQIDIVFGTGTSQKCFGDAMVLRAFEQFFSGITPYIKSSREEKVVKYVPKIQPAKGKGRKPRTIMQ
jgi:hypothetical protein